MDKSAFKIIRFLLMIPIKIIKYFSLGIYFVGTVLSEILLYSIIFSSFFVYKSVKYLFLSFTFPVVLFNFFKCKNKKNSDTLISLNKKVISDNALDLADSVNIGHQDGNQELVEQPQIIEENIAIEENKVIDEPQIIEETILVEEPQIIESMNRLEDNVADYKETVATEKIIKDEPIKVKVPKKRVNIFKYLFLPFEIVSYPVYKVFKYLYLGVSTSLMLVYNGFVFISFIAYKIFKYLLFSLGSPMIIVNVIFRKNQEKILKRRQIKEENRLIREEEKFKKQLALQKKQEEKLRIKLKKKKEQEEYINENVKLEKKTFKERFDEVLNILFSSPKVLVDKIKDSIHNSTFMKDKRNRRDINRQALLISFEGEDAEKSDVKLVYQYTAKNEAGKIITDYFEAFSKVEVHSFLLSEGYEVYNIKTNKWIQFLHQSSANSKAKVKNKDLIFFLTQLSTYIKAGIPLVESLKILARQYNKNKKYQRLFRSIIYDLTMGENFSTALSKQGEAFPRILINMIKASEMTGELPEVLDDMAEYFTEMDKTRKQMITALMYPMIILVISIAVVVFILLFVIPKFVDIYESMDASSIPKFTLAVLAVSDFLKNYSILLLVGIVVAVIILVYLYKHVKGFRTLCQWLFMHTPVMKSVIIYNEVTNFTKTFASLLSHNVFITDSMEILTKITNNEIYKMMILDTITNLAKGEKISTAFKDHWAFPVPAYEMLVTGEKTGQLPEMMAKVSDYYQDLHKNAVTRIKTFIEPILIIFLTVVVGIIVLSIIIPMFSMYGTIQGIGQ